MDNDVHDQYLIVSVLEHDKFKSNYAHSAAKVNEDIEKLCIFNGMVQFSPKTTFGKFVAALH